MYPGKCGVTCSILKRNVAMAKSIESNSYNMREIKGRRVISTPATSSTPVRRRTFFSPSGTGFTFDSENRHHRICACNKRLPHSELLNQFERIFCILIERGIQARVNDEKIHPLPPGFFPNKGLIALHRKEFRAYKS